MALEGYPSSMSVSVSENIQTMVYVNIPNLMCLTPNYFKVSLVVLHQFMYVRIFGSIELVTESLSVISMRNKSNFPYAHRNHKHFIHYIYSASEIRQEHPLNLSISISGGKEIN